MFTLCLILIFSILGNISISLKNMVSLKPFEWNSSIALICHLNQTAIVDVNLYGYILINARLFYKIPPKLHHKFLISNIPLTENRYSIAIYSSSNQYSSLQLIGVNDIDIVPNSFDSIETYMGINDLIMIDYNKPSATLSHPILSTYYTTINYNEAIAWQNISYNMKQLNMDYAVPTFESVIKTDDNITIYDLNAKWAWTINTKNDSIKRVQQMDAYYMEEPTKFGFYCIYTNPPNTTNIVPDCPNATDIIKEHSKMLYSSGIDFMLPDDTNLVGGMNNIQSYVLQIRPNQLILDTFTELKKNGSNVPYVGIWNKGDGDQWQVNLEFYNNYSDIIYSAVDERDVNKIIKKPYFIVSGSNSNINETVIELIASDNGKNDISIIEMWCHEPLQLTNNGTWSWMQGCFTDNTYKKETTSLETATECNFQMTKNSVLGSQISATFADNGGPGSLAFSSPNKLNGRTFQLIIKDCLKLKPDNVFYPSFNEHSCGQHDIPYGYGGNNTWSNGLYKDVNRSIFFYDTYGSEVNRAFEPTKESGDYYYLLFQSCSRVLRLQYSNYFGDLLSYDTNDTICNVENEICCNNLTKYYDVWSLKTKNNSDYILSNNKNEVNNLIINANYVEICAGPYARTSVFCISNDDVHTNQSHQGPFILYADGTNPSMGSLPVVNIKRVPIYRCITNNGLHFIANDNNCNGIENSKMEYLLGYAAGKPSTAMGRRLMRCINDYGIYYHTVGAECFENGSHSMLLGFAL